MIFPSWQVRYLQAAVDCVGAKVPFDGIATVTPESYERATRNMADFLRSYGLFTVQVLVIGFTGTNAVGLS